MKNSASCWTLPPVRKSFKLVVLGDSGVGKTVLVNSICSISTRKTVEPTIAVDYQIKEYRSMILNIWDVSGNPYYRTLAQKFYQDVSVFILVFDVTKRRTYDSLVTWKEEVKSFVDNECKVLICGNKTDLSQFRQVDDHEAQYFAHVHGFAYLEVSALHCHSGKKVLEFIASSAQRDVFNEDGF